MTSNEQLIQAVEELRDLMTKVATGVERIPDVNDRFRRVYGVVASALVRLNISNPLPFGDLWDWYARWKEGDMPTYQSRRIYVADLFLPLLDQLRSGGATPYAPTGWARVDRTVDQYRERLATARTVEQYQTVGLLCREALISAAQAVYDPTRHKTADGVVPSQTDAKRLLEAFIATELAGSVNEEARKHARSSLDLAVALQHRRTAAFRDAALCAEATTATINIVAIVSGRRDPSDEPAS